MLSRSFLEVVAGLADWERALVRLSIMNLGLLFVDFKWIVCILQSDFSACNYSANTSLFSCCDQLAPLRRVLGAASWQIVDRH